MGVIEIQETEVPRLDEFEREEITAEPLETADVPLEDEIPEQAVLEEETADPPQPEEDQAKPEKPIKGPRFWAWSVAVLLMLFGLGMLVPAVWNAMLVPPAVSGLVAEAAGNYESAMEAYGQLYQTDQETQALGLPALGLSSGTFPMERQYIILGKLYGPLYFVRYQMSISMSFQRVPRGLRKLAAQCDELSGILDGVNVQLEALGEAAGGQDSAWLLAGLEAARAADEKADARELYYQAIALQFTAGDPEQKQANLDRIAALKADPGGRFWMYEDVEFFFASQSGDYDTLAAISDARMKRNRQESQAMQDKIRAVFLGNGADKALAEAKALGRRSAARDSMQLAKAEINYRQGKFDQAIALCDAILDKADLAAPAETPAQTTALRSALEAAGVKGVVLLLQGKPGDAAALLNSTWDAAEMNGVSPRLNYVYILLAAYIAGGDEDGASGLAQQLAGSGYAIPQVISDLQEGGTTIEKIFTEGWGGFDA